MRHLEQVLQKRRLLAGSTRGGVHYGKYMGIFKTEMRRLAER